MIAATVLVEDVVEGGHVDRVNQVGDFEHDEPVLLQKHVRGVQEVAEILNQVQDVVAQNHVRALALGHELLREVRVEEPAQRSDSLRVRGIDGSLRGVDPEDTDPAGVEGLQHAAVVARLAASITSELASSGWRAMIASALFVKCSTIVWLTEV